MPVKAAPKYAFCKNGTCIQQPKQGDFNKKPPYGKEDTVWNETQQEKNACVAV